MDVELIVSPEAERDLQEANEWYDNQRRGLGREFIEHVDHAFERICRMPESHAVAYRSVRVAPLRRFPYLICYTFSGHTVWVHAVIHGHRDPNVWQERIE